MKNPIQVENFTTTFFALLEETVEGYHGIYLNENTCLFMTLDGITAEEASIPVGGKCASIAAQTAHVTLSLEAFEGYILGNDMSYMDWDEIWRTVEKVTPQQWDEYRSNLKITYARVKETLKNLESWDARRPLVMGMAIIAHTAYHLGEIRQATCVVKK